MIGYPFFFCDVDKNSAGNQVPESTLTCESETIILQKGNLALDKESQEYKALKKRRRDAIRLTIAKMERAQQVCNKLNYVAIAIFLAIYVYT